MGPGSAVRDARRAAVLERLVAQRRPDDLRRPLGAKVGDPNPRLGDGPRQLGELLDVPSPPPEPAARAPGTVARLIRRPVRAGVGELTRLVGGGSVRISGRARE